MKKIIGLDLGTNSIGWSVVEQAENDSEKSSIIKVGVRVNPLTVDEKTNFEKGKSITTNADRTLKRSMRRNLQRFKQRRENLIALLKSNHFINDNVILSETGNFTTFETYRLRAKAANQEISLEQLARVLLMINKKRGYKSNRKMQSQDDGQAIDAIDIAKKMYDEGLTPAEYALDLLKSGKKKIPDFYLSDLRMELDKLWKFQQPFYPEILNNDVKEQIFGNSKTKTSRFFYAKFNLETASVKERDLRIITIYEWRVKALSERISIEEVIAAICDINGAISNSSGYLGTISDHSKELYFNNLTVGQYQMQQLDNCPNFSLRNQIFYRQDYLDEFERIWETQAKFHIELTPKLKQEVRDIVIFYQRRLKSQKKLISFCEFENKNFDVEINGNIKNITTGKRVCPKSSPLFQEFKIWSTINNIELRDKYENSIRTLELEEMQMLAKELSIKENLSKKEILNLLRIKGDNISLNFKSISGDKTQATLFKIYHQIAEYSGHDCENFEKLNYSDKIKFITSVFSELGFKTDFLEFYPENIENQPMFRLWHLLYSFESDNSNTGNEKLIAKIQEMTNLDKEYAVMLSNVSFPLDYGNICSKAMLKILPFLKAGNKYSVACEYAGYKHSKDSLTKEELENKVLKQKLEIIPKNSLRNPVVEKIINQMINVVNGIISEYGTPDEIHIELARELKKSAKEREDLSLAILKSTADYEDYTATLKKEFGLIDVSRNDIIRYRLYMELKDNGFRTLYTNTYIPREKLFSRDFDIEHIIPQARLFDDSFSNKTLECRQANIEKGNKTALDYVSDKFGESGINEFQSRIKYLDKEGTRAKYKKLKMPQADIPQDFINRDLGDSQYIAKKAKLILSEIVKVVLSTTGSITSRLREDWQLVDIMQELNWDKYEKLGLTEITTNRDGHQIRRITDWTKRNDHRHHAMDALTIAFTKHSHIQYLNNLNARSDRNSAIYGIEQKELYRDKNGKLRFIPPMPLDVFRYIAKEQLENTLISIKAKNKVVTRNINKTKAHGKVNLKIQLTPRGQLHNESVFGAIKRYATKEETVGSAFNADKIATVANKTYREALLKRFNEFNNDAKLAFTGRNSLEKKPIFLNELHTDKIPAKVKTVKLEQIFTIRKPIDKDLRLDKVVDAGVRKILESRLQEFDGNAAKAFSNLEENPIWLNKDKNIRLKRVSITGITNALAIHEKHDKDGNIICDNNGMTSPADFVSTSNNHHVAIYRDSNGRLHENVVSFFEATERANQGLSIIDIHFRESEGWTFLFTMKQNEYFVFPKYENYIDEDDNECKRMIFNPADFILTDPANYALISPNLFRVQKITSKDYWFRHHLETTVVDNKRLQDITWKRCSSLDFANNVFKVRINHIGQIVTVGEY
ncbi:MAG: type II CRISPR RNA-guided endonuclease Cas9 [Muribaculaceae bacterium]